MNREKLVELTVEIVSSNVANSNSTSDEVAKLIANVYKALSEAGGDLPVVREDRKPAVPIRASVKPDAVTCLECGFTAKMLRSHLLKTHNLTPGEYKSRWGLNHAHPLVAPNYAEVRRALAIKLGLGQKPVPQSPQSTRSGRGRASRK